MARIDISTDTNVITDSLLGFTAFNQNVKLFDFGNVIVRKDYRDVKDVRLISGGGSGSEPVYAGFVGKGMLTAAVHGTIFQSPNSKVVLRTIKELNFDHSNGILVITLGNKGTVLNFGLAVERAIKENIRVKMIVVSDDCNNNNYPIHKKRGLCGIVLIIKLAGALAAAGYNLNEIYSACMNALESLYSVSVGMKHLYQTIDVCLCKKMIESNEIEIGVGMNEEPGIKKLKLSSSSDISKIIVRELYALYYKDESNLEKPQLPVVILVNNINGLAVLEERVLIKELLTVLNLRNIPVARLYAGRFFSSPTLIGVIVSSLTVQDEKFLEFLDAPTDAADWQTVNQIAPLTLANTIPGKLERKLDKYVPPVKGPKLSGRQANIMLAGIQFACDALISCERQLNIVDSEQGDGDTGTRLKKVCELILHRMSENKIPFECPCGFFDSLSKMLESLVGGTLGCIYCILFETAANYFAECQEDLLVDCELWLGALERACGALKRYGVIEFGDHTMYDPLEVCLRTIKENLANKMDVLEAFEVGVQAAQETAHKTRLQHCKYPDSGAHAVGIWLRALFEGIKLVMPNYIHV